MEVVGYTWYAACYCEACGADLPEVDPEGNDKHPLFSTDEAGDTPDTCDTCHAMIDTSWSGATVAGAVEQLRGYIEAALRGDEHKGNTDYLDECVDHMSWCGTDKLDDLVVSTYNHVRENDNV